MSLFAELKRRNVIRVAGLYLVGAWLIVQVVSTVLPAFDLPGWALRGVILLLAIGFMPALVVSWVFEMTPDGLRRDREVAAGESIAPQTAQRMNRTIIAVLLLALGFFAFDKFALAPTRQASVATTPDEVPATADLNQSASSVPPGESSRRPVVSDKSIAVLAFSNLSADKDNEYFSDGVAEEILNALARVQELRVAGRTSSFYFKGRSESLAAIGSTLGVANILDGSVRKQGDRLRISAQLIRVSDGFQLWSDTFDGTDADIFALQESIAQKVTSELRVALNAGQQSRLVEVGTNNPEAYRLYLKATDVFNRRAFERFDEAIAVARDAVAVDPNFARAYSRLATLYYVGAAAAPTVRFDEFMKDAAGNAEQALRLDPRLAEPHAVLGAMHMLHRRYRQAHDEYELALSIDPNDPTTNFWQAIFQCQIGYIGLCEQGLDRTLAIDPLLPNALNWRARLLVSAGELPAAEQMAKRAREVGLSWAGVSIAWVALARGDLASARTETEGYLARHSASLPAGAMAAFAGARVGDAESRTRALKIIDDYLAENPARISAPVPLALLWMGESERGLALFASRDTTDMPSVLGDVLGTRLYPQVWASPAFPVFLRKTGIAAYWDEFGPPPHCRKNDAGDYRCE